MSPNDRSEERPTTLDQAISRPEQDLLGVGVYATRLANYIMASESGLTIGVYGQWGAGKTSFVQLVKRELGTRVRFITFVAWPYKTSDELWRALILAIARDLYEIDPEFILDKSRAAEPESFVQRVRGLLASNAVVLHDASRTDQLDTFKDLVAELDRIELGSIKKSTGPGLSDPEAVQATVKTVAAAVAAVSPLGGAIRGLLGLGDGLGRVPQADTSRSTLTRMQSIERFRGLLERLFAKRAPNTRLCVFIDDLDRAMPDVALDLLEAIRIFLGEVDCTFIVAADQELIGQGLKARFRDLMDTAQSQHDRDFYTRKGREYFEKIIQFGVPVPEPTVEEGYKFVGASFPGWAAAADLITTGVGANPRRLRQYCGLLDYRRGVWQLRGPMPRGGDAPSDGLSDELRDKVSALYWRDAELIAALAPFTQRSDARDQLSVLENLLAQWRPGVALDPTTEPRLADSGLQALYQRAVSSSPLRERLAQAPLLSQQTSLDRETVLAVCDLQPGVPGVLKTRDAAFGRVLEKLLQGIPIHPETLLREDLTRLLELNRDEPTVLDRLVELAAMDAYQSQLQALEETLRDSTMAEPEWSAPAEALLNFATDDEVELKELDRRREIILRKPALFSLSPALVKTFADQRQKLPDARTLLPKEIFGDNPSQATQIEALAGHLLKDLPGDMHNALRVRIACGEHAIERRRFAKVDALAHSWPELGAYRNYDRPTLLAIEAHALDGTPLTGTLMRFSADERLIRFLRLRPYFRELYPADVKAIAATTASAASAPAMIAQPAPGTPVSVPAPAPVAPPVLVPAPEPAPATPPPAAPATVQTPATAPAPAPEPPPVEQPVPIVEPAQPRREPTTEAPQKPPVVDAPSPQVLSVGAVSSAPSVGNLYLDFQFSGARTELAADGTPCEFQLSDDNGYRLARGDFRLFPLEAIREDDGGPSALQFLLERQERDLGREGNLIYLARKVLRDRLRFDRLCRLQVRLVTNADTAVAGVLGSLAWETLYVPETLSFPVLDGTLSVVRSLRQQPLVPPRDEPIRLLAVLPSPTNAPSAGMAECQDVLNRVIETVRPAKMQILADETATPTKIREALRRFRPNVFYYFGHAVEGALLLADDRNLAVRIDAARMQTLLLESGVILAVLIGSNTGSAGTGGVHDSVAGRLAATHVPAVVGTLGNVQQRSGVLFTNAFFMALLQGENVELAMTEARRSLDLQGHDWSRYALFSGTDRVDLVKWPTSNPQEAS